jgi:hypothetical protein
MVSGKKEISGANILQAAAKLPFIVNIYNGAETSGPCMRMRWASHVARMGEEERV